MDTDFLGQGEIVENSWSVFVGADGPTSAKITGKLVATNLNLHFRADLELDKNAIFNMYPDRTSNEPPPFQASDKHVKIPYNQIGDVTIKKSWIVLKSLVLTLREGGSLFFRFGAMSPAKALAAINRHID